MEGDFVLGIGVKIAVDKREGREQEVQIIERRG